MTVPLIDWGQELAEAELPPGCVVNAHAVDEELDARPFAGELVKRMTQLLDVTAALGDAGTQPEVARIVVHEGLDVLDASAGLVVAVESGETRALDWRVERGGADSAPPTVLLAGAGPIAETLRRRQPVWVESDERF